MFSKKKKKPKPDVYNEMLVQCTYYPPSGSMNPPKDTELTHPHGPHSLDHRWFYTDIMGLGKRNNQNVTDILKKGYLL